MRCVNTTINKRAKDGSFELVLDSRDCYICPTKISKAVSARAIHLSSDYESGEKVSSDRGSSRGAGKIFG